MRRRKMWEAPAAALLVIGMLTLAGGPAMADDPVGDLTTKVKDGVKPPTDAPSPGKQTKARTSTPSSDPGEPSDQDETPPNEVADPEHPDHAGASLLDTTVGGQPAASLGSNKSTVEDDDSTKGDSTLLALGGTEIVGAHTDSSGNNHASEAALAPVTDPVCEQSQTAFCFNVLFADSNATEDGTHSHSDAENGIVEFCVGGEEEGDDCEAPLEGTVGGSTTQADRNQRTGRTTASSESGLADVCATSPQDSPVPFALPIPESPGCGVGVSLLQSEGAADSGGANPSAHRDSTVAGLTLAGQTFSDEDLAALLIPGCPIPGLLCAFTNQGETYLGPDSLAGHAQEALRVEILPGILNKLGIAPSGDLFTLVGGRTETLVHNDGGEPAPPDVAGEEGENAGNPRPAVVAGVDASPGGLLPNTGGPSLGLLSLGLLGIGLGAMLIAVSRSSRLLVRQA